MESQIFNLIHQALANPRTQLLLNEVYEAINPGAPQIIREWRQAFFTEDALRAIPLRDLLSIIRRVIR
jgi:hypothetical protein